MKKNRFWSALSLVICVFALPAFPIEISKDTVQANDIDFTSCWPSSAEKDTLALWNTGSSSILLDSVDMIVTPSQDGFFRTTNCANTYSVANAPDRIQMAYPDENGIGLVKTAFNLQQSNNLYRAHISALFTNFFLLLSFNGPDTCFIPAILIADCIECASTERYLIDFSARVTLYYSDGSQVSFHLVNRHTVGVKTGPAYPLHREKSMPDNGIFNMKGQMFHRSAGSYSHGIYLRTIKNNHEKLILPLNRACLKTNE